ncbi:MAG: YVTN family beta-propeller protein [Acidimicrobiales bacterium]|jgi:YVTN family beta-propeller protein
MSNSDDAAGSTESTVSVIDVGAAPQTPALINGAVWIANFDVGTVMVVDPTTQRIVNTIEVGDGPVTPVFAAGSVWIANQLEGTLTQVDPVTAEVVAVLTVGAEPGVPAVVNGQLWVPNLAGGNISRVDPLAGDVVGTIVVQQRPSTPVVGAGSVWVANEWSSTVSQIDADTGTVLATIPVGILPQQPLVVGGQVFVANVDGGTLTVIDVADLSRSTVDLGSGSQPQKPVYDGSTIWIPLFGASALAPLDPATGTVGDFVGVDPNPLTPLYDGAYLWVPNEASSVQQVDAATRAVLKTFPIDFAAGGRLSYRAGRVRRRCGSPAASIPVLPLSAMPRLRAQVCPPTRPTTTRWRRRPRHPWPTTVARPGPSIENFRSSS